MTPSPPSPCTTDTTLAGAPNSLAEQIAGTLGDMTSERWTAVAVENAHANEASIRKHGQSIAALRHQPIGRGDSAFVMGAGPSMKTQRPAEVMLEAGYRGAVICTDQGLRHCLPYGLIPDLLVTVEVRPRVVRWFGYPTMSRDELLATNFYRLDIDPFFKDFQSTPNDEVRELVNTYGPQLRIALPTTASEAMTRRAVDTGMEIYWWNPMLDDPDQPGSVTRQLQQANGMPSINAGGNVGAASWMMAYAVLEKQQIALTGMDYSVPDGSPLTSLPHYETCANLVGPERVDTLVSRIFNPHDQTWHMTDPTYIWYRNSFFEIVEASHGCHTTNCTETGILFNDHIEYATLQQFLSCHA